MKNGRLKIVESEAFPGILLLAGTLIALIFANTGLSGIYNKVLYEIGIGEEFNLHFFINDFLMSIFFLVVGCEIKRELVFGKLSSFKQAAFPVICAIGGMAVPALIFTLFNYRGALEIGVGIPLSTDIAFAIGVFTVFEKRVNTALKIFLLTLAVVDDLLTIVIIGIFYSSNIRLNGIIATIIISLFLLSIRKFRKINNIYTYAIGGFLLWCAVLYSGVHATLSGVILAFTLPIYDESGRDKDICYKVQHKLEPITNFIILPLFAFANTGVTILGNLNMSSSYTLMVGIILGLVIGKPLGIMLFGYLGSLFKISRKPEGSSWMDILIVSVIAGIGFTMSLFISELAFKGETMEINASKISILIAAVISTALAYILSIFTQNDA